MHIEVVLFVVGVLLNYDASHYPSVLSSYQPRNDLSHNLRVNHVYIIVRQSYLSTVYGDVYIRMKVTNYHYVPESLC